MSGTGDTIARIRFGATPSRVRPSLWLGERQTVAVDFLGRFSGAAVDASGVSAVLYGPHGQILTPVPVRVSAGLWHVDVEPSAAGTWRLQVNATTPDRAVDVRDMTVRATTPDYTPPPPALWAPPLVDFATEGGDQLAADKAWGKLARFSAAAALVLTVGVGRQFTSVQAAVEALALWNLPPAAQVRIEVQGQVEVTAAQIAVANTPNAPQIDLVGARAPLTRTLQATGHTVTGTQGNWTITAAVDSTTDVEVGQVVLPSPSLPAQSLHWGYDGNAQTRWGKITTSGTAITLEEEQAPYALPLSTGMGLIINDEMIGLSGGSGLSWTSDVPLRNDVTKQVYWYAGTWQAGTCGTSGSSVNVALTGGSYTPVRGDVAIFRVDNTPIFRRVEGTAAGGFEIYPAANIPPGSQWMLMRHADAHVGAFRITAVDHVAKTVTWSSGFNGNIDLAASQLAGGTLTILRDVLRNLQGGGHGLLGGSGRFFRLVDNLGIVGNGGLASIGVGADGTTRTGAGHARLGTGSTPRVGITNFGWGLVVYQGSAWADRLCVGNSLGSWAMHCYQGRLYARHARIGAAGTYGVFVGPGGSLYDSNAIYAGQPISMYGMAGGSRYADGAESVGAQDTGWQMLSRFGYHVVESRIWCAGITGLSSSSGAGGRFAGSLVVCPGYKGETMAGTTGNCYSFGQADADSFGHETGAEGSYAAGFGPSGSVLIISGGSVEATYFAAAGAGVSNVIVNQGAADLRFLHASYAVGRGILAGLGANVRAETSRCRNNTAADYEATGWGSVLRVTGFRHLGSVFATERNIPVGGAIIIDTGLGAPQSMAIRRAVVEFPATVLAAGAAPSEVIYPLVGVRARDAIDIGPVDTAAVNGRILWSGVAGTDQIKVHTLNPTGASVSIPLQSIQVIAQRGG